MLVEKKSKSTESIFILSDYQIQKDLSETSILLEEENNDDFFKSEKCGVK